MMEHPVHQGSEAWHLLRLGRPTASEFDRLVTPLGKVKTGDGPQTYLYEKLAEHLTGKPLDDGSTWAMSQGSLLESEAIPFYELVYGAEVRKVGFVTTDDMRIGCSPDGLIGEDSGLECKCALPQTHLRYLLEGGVPKEYVAQVQGCMFVTQRPRWVFLSYCRKMPPHIVHVERDEAFQQALTAALNQFLANFDNALEKLETLSQITRAVKRATMEAV